MTAAQRQYLAATNEGACTPKDALQRVQPQGLERPKASSRLSALNRQEHQISFWGHSTRIFVCRMLCMILVDRLFKSDAGSYTHHHDT